MAATIGAEPPPADVAGANLRRKAIIVAIAVGLVASAAFLAMLVELPRQQQTASQRVNDTLEVLDSVATLNADVAKAVSEARGFMIDKNPDSNQRFNAATGQVSDEMARLKDLTADNPTQQSTLVHIAPVIAARIDVIRDIVDRLNAGEDVSVRDDGPGIAPEHQLKIFEPFHRLNRSDAHSGLGLAICKKIIDRHGGKIGCLSEVGLGSSFFFTLNGAAVASSGMARPVPAEMQEPNESVATANVLLVDDREADILLARAVLSGPKGMRCNFLIANDGQEGLAAMRNPSRKNDPIDLILLDINMPVMNGFEMLEAVIQDTELMGIPVVMCAGSTWDKDKERARVLGATGFLTKPALLKDLRPIIAKSSGIRLVDQAGGLPILMRNA